MSKIYKGLFLFLFVFITGVAIAQETKEVTGKVTDADGAPIPGATIRVVGGRAGTATDLNGDFKFTVLNNINAVTVNAIGYQEQTASLTGSHLNITLERGEGASDAGQEVIVTAYGTQTRESVAGSISTLKAEEIGQSQTANVVQSLAGKVGGVQIRSTTGQPGASSTVRFRGIGSISSSNQPLFVVDGVPYNGDVAAISPQDIEEISFLKDASANALYGSRGANGVIIITTKKGKGRMNITYEGRVGINSRAVPDYDIITDPKEYYELRWQRLRLGVKVNTPSITWEQAGVAASNGLVKDLGYNIFNVPNAQVVDAGTGKINSAAQLLYQDDWSKALFKNSVRQEHFVSIRYGTEKLSSYLSGGYLRDEGYVVNSGFDRVSARINLDYTPYDFLKVGANMNYAGTKAKDPQAGKASGTYSNLFSWTRNIAPIYPIYARDKDGEILLDANGNQLYDWGKGETINPDGTASSRVYITNMNPYATTLLNTQTNENKNLSMRGYVSLNFLRDFNFTYNLGYDFLGSFRTRVGTELGGDAAPYGGSITNASMFDATITNQQLLSYRKIIGDHNVDLMIGHESSDYVSKMLAGNKTNIVIPGEIFLSNATKYGSLNGYNDNYSVEGYLSKLNYSYLDRYYVNASFRRDGSSIFHPDHRWGNFYGIGGAWLISKENFLIGNTLLTNLKLKASYGEQGNDYLFYPSYVSMDHRSHFSFGRNFLPYITQYDITSDAEGNASIREAYVGTKDLKWEVSKNFNVGAEISLLNRVNIEVEYFKRAVSDMLYNFPQPPSSGVPSISRNIGDMSNTGVEISIDGDIVRNNDWNVNLWANATHYKNKITRLPDPFNTGVFRFVEGQSSYTYYLREYVGVDNETGYGKWHVGGVDTKTGLVNGAKRDTSVHSAASLYLSDKTAHPDLYGGFGLNIRYKNLSFSAGFAYQLGGYVYDDIYAGFFSEGTGMGSSGHNYHRDVYNTWTPENKTASLPILSSVNRTQYGGSDLFLIGADYISWENVSLSYDLPVRFLERLNMQGAKISLLGNNLWVGSKRQGLDPRMMQIGGNINNGLSLNSYSLLKSLSIGLTLKF